MMFPAKTDVRGGDCQALFVMWQTSGGRSGGGESRYGASPPLSKKSACSIMTDGDDLTGNDSYTEGVY